MLNLMTSIVISLYGVLMVGLGYALGRMHRPYKPEKKEEQTMLVKRVKPSFRHPTKTHTTSYDEYKTSKGLYAPVRPGKNRMADEIEVKQ